MDIIILILFVVITAILVWVISQINGLCRQVNLLENRLDRLETKNKLLSNVLIEKTHEAIVEFLESEVQENE